MCLLVNLYRSNNALIRLAMWHRLVVLGKIYYTAVKIYYVPAKWWQSTDKIFQKFHIFAQEKKLTSSLSTYIHIVYIYIICPHRGVYCIWIIHSLSALVRHWGEVRKRFHQHKIQSLLGGNIAFPSTFLKIWWLDLR